MHAASDDSRRATVWRLRTRTLALPARPLVMGILNITPDSFSDGGQFVDPARAAEHALRLAAEGADIIDVGGESTRPFSEPVSADEELRRVMPVLVSLCGKLSIPVSIDTSKAVVAREALAAGAEIINDVTALSGDEMLSAVAVDSGAGLCLMHMQGTPQTMQLAPCYDDVVAEVAAFLAARRDALVGLGIDPARIALDPGIGFGKTHQHNLTLLAACWQLHELGQPLVVGHSRKGFIAKVLGHEPSDRTPGTIGVALSLASQGVQVIRVHGVAAVREALLLYEATGGIDGTALVL